MKTFTLTIRTPEKQVYSGKAQFLKLFTETGLIKLFPGHADLTATLNFSPVIFADHDGKEEDYVARRGLLRVDCLGNSMDLMVFDCSLKSELSPLHAKEYLKFIETELAKGTDLSDFKVRYLEEERFVIEKQIKYLN
ncbi:F0F1 ATP synthase subunit epsilon [Candidatus Peregrinibacteria bacterium]|nr:F0F1 ATP synthase subunit epsilon [Candidatus Peregrinibacteria bacterium]